MIKSLKVDYQKRAKGALRAVATLTDEQIAEITSKDKGDVDVKVVVTDEVSQFTFKLRSFRAFFTL